MNASEGRRFGLTVGIAFVVITAVLVWRDHTLPSRVTGFLGGILIAGGLLFPTAMGPVERGWMAFAHMISKVTTPIFMAVVFFLVLTPTGLLRRALGGDALKHGTGPSDTYWKDKDEERTGGLERQF